MAIRRKPTKRGESTRRPNNNVTGSRRGGSPARQDPAVRRQILQLLVSGSIFLLVAAGKLLLPEMANVWGQHLSQAMNQNLDVTEVFSAVGRAFAPESDLRQSLDYAWQTVFPDSSIETGDSSALPDSSEEPISVTSTDTAADSRESPESDGADSAQSDGADSAQSYGADSAQSEDNSIWYTDENLPDNVSMAQCLLDFDYCTPVKGTLTSEFGYREHPLEGEERFHYGIDLAADTGTAIQCFADGTVTALGESSSYGQYLIVTHAGGYSTLYAHCSKLIASSGSDVEKGETIAEVGETGNTTGPHLHFELHQGSMYLNPIYYVETAS